MTYLMICFLFNFVDRAESIIIMRVPFCFSFDLVTLDVHRYLVRYMHSYRNHIAYHRTKHKTFYACWTVFWRN